MDGKTTETGADPGSPAALPAEVLADLLNLIEAMHEEKPTRPAPVIPKAAVVKPSSSSETSSFTSLVDADLDGDAAADPDVDAGTASQPESALSVDLESEATSAVSAEEGDPIGVLSNEGPDAVPVATKPDEEPILDLRAPSQGELIPLPSNWLDSSGRKRSRRRFSVRENWPFLLALVFIALGVVLIFLVLTSN